MRFRLDADPIPGEDADARKEDQVSAVEFSRPEGPSRSGTPSAFGPGGFRAVMLGVVAMCAAAAPTHGLFRTLTSLLMPEETVRTARDVYLVDADGWCEVAAGTVLVVGRESSDHKSVRVTVRETPGTRGGTCPAGRSGFLQRWEVDAVSAARDAVRDGR